jgi:hypothetical protein
LKHSSITSVTRYLSRSATGQPLRGCLRSLRRQPGGWLTANSGLKRVTRYLSRSANIKDNGQPLCGCLRSLLRNRFAVVSANSRPLLHGLAKGHNPLSFTLSEYQGRRTTALRLSPEFAPPAWRLAYRKLRTEACNPLSFTLNEYQGRRTTALRLSPEFAPPAWRLAYRKLQAQSACFHARRMTRTTDNRYAVVSGVCATSLAAGLPQTPGPIRLLSRSANDKDNGQPLRGCLRSLRRQPGGWLTANSRPLLHGLAKGRNPLSFTLNDSQG